MNSPHSAGLQGNTIVVVDDEPLLLLLMEDIVEELGFMSQPFIQADDALAFLIATHTDIRLVLTDFSTPGSISGGDLATAVALRFPPVPVIVTSGFTDAAFKLPPGAVFIPKPWPVGAMYDLIKRLTSKPD